MSLAAAAGSNPSGSTSTIVIDTARGYHLLKIDGYSLTKALYPNGFGIQSSQFTVGGNLWRIHYYPNGNCAGSSDYMSLVLSLDGDAAKNNKVKAMWKFHISQTGHLDNPPSLASAKVDTFGLGYTKFIKRDDFEKSQDLRDDSFTIRCDISVFREIHAVQTTEIQNFISVPPSDMNQHLGDLLETEKGADVVFEVSGQTFAAHRCVLAARSPVFSAELYGLMKEGDTAGVVRIEDMEAQVFKLLLRFVYTDSLPEMEEDEDVMCQHLLVAADRYNLQRLRLMCEDRLCRYIGVGTVGNVLVLADQHNCDGLKKACFHFLSSPANLSAFLAGDGFDHLSRSCPSLMKELVAMLVPRHSHA
uniref:BTB domain-containing protein n=1 Tax=Leersia perrieri TaxID=77586 RepID=A0A0D9XJW4_9ORYZ